MIAALSARDRTGRRGLVLPRRSDRDPGPRADPEWMLAGPNSLLLTTHSGPRGADVPQGSLSERPRGSRGQTEFLVKLKTRSDPIGCTSCPVSGVHLSHLNAAGRHKNEPLDMLGSTFISVRTWEAPR